MGVVVLPAEVVKSAVQAAIDTHQRPASMNVYGPGRNIRLLTELLELVTIAERQPEPRLVGVTLEEMGLLEKWLDT